MSTSRLFLLGLVGVMLTLGYQFIVFMKESPVIVTSVLDETDAYSHGYNLIDVIAPASTGPALSILSYVVTKSVLSPWILRHLLNKNGATHVREFAAKYCKKLHPMAFPIHHPTTEQIEIAQQWTDSHPNILQTGFDLQPPPPPPSPSSSQQESQSQHTTVLKDFYKYRTVMDYHRLYLSKKATPSQVMDRWMEGAKQLSHLQIFATLVDYDDIRAQAKASEERYASNQPLSVWDGVPVAVKDQSPVKGYRTCHGSSECVGPHDEDDHPAAALRAAGAILVGLTVMTEGGVTPLGYNAFFDGPFNPYSTNHYSGGSSSGSAVAVASGLVPMAVGWDGGGSIRVPASMSGVVGLAVTFGRIPFESNSNLYSSVKAGPLAATVTDAALSYMLLGQPVPNSFYTDLIGLENLPPPHLMELVHGQDVIAPSAASGSSTMPLDGVRLGVFWDHFQHTDKEVYSKCTKVVSYLEGKGATIVNITIPHLREIHLSHGFKILSEFGYGWESRFFNSSYLMEGNTEVTVALGRALTATEILAAQKIRTFGSRYIRNEIFKNLNIDAIVSPMLGTKVPELPPGVRGYGESNTPLVYKVMRFVPLANILGLPAISIPVGFEDETGLPIGFQLLGDAFEETKLLKIAAIVEQYHDRRLPKSENYFDVLSPWM